MLGDWIVLSDGTEGRVVETNWRSTQLLTLTHNVVTLPNSFLARLGLTNVSSPDESHGLSIAVRLAPTNTPATAVDVMRAVLSSCDSILREPPPVVAIKNLDAMTIEVELRFAWRMSAGELPQEMRSSIFPLGMKRTPPTLCIMACPRFP